MADLWGSVWAVSLDRVSGWRGSQDAAGCSGDPDRRGIHRLNLIAVTTFRITVVVDTTQEKGNGESDVRYTHSGSKDAEGTPEAEQRFLPDLSDAV